MHEITFLAACKDFFGLKPGQTAVQFLQEVKGLTDTDREELKPGLEKALGVTIIRASVK